MAAVDERMRRQLNRMQAWRPKKAQFSRIWRPVGQGTASTRRYRALHFSSAPAAASVFLRRFQHGGLRCSVARE